MSTHQRRVLECKPGNETQHRRRVGATRRTLDAACGIIPPAGGGWKDTLHRRIAMEIIMRSIQEIRPYEKNPRKNDDAVKYVAESIKEFGFKVPIVIDRDGVIVAGHTRFKAAKKLKMDSVPCIVADDLSEEQIKAFRLADNKVAEKAEWDFALLTEELDDLFDFDMDLFGFGDEDEEDDEEERPAVERDDLSGQVGEMYQIVIECANETEQEQLFYRFTEEGLKCRTLIL